VRLLLIIVLSLIASTAVALPADLIGRASIIDGDTIEVHGTRTSGASTRPKVPSSAGTKTATYIGAAPRPPMTSTASSRGRPSSRAIDADDFTGLRGGEVRPPL
jgi:hypothetical protein